MISGCNKKRVYIWTGFWSWNGSPGLFVDVDPNPFLLVHFASNSFQCRFRDFSVNKNDPQ